METEAYCKGCRSRFVPLHLDDPPPYCSDKCQAAYASGMRDAIDKAVTVLVQVAYNARQRASAMVVNDAEPQVPRSKIFDAISRTVSRVTDTIRRLKNG